MTSSAAEALITAQNTLDRDFGYNRNGGGSYHQTDIDIPQLLYTLVVGRRFLFVNALNEYLQWMIATGHYNQMEQMRNWGIIQIKYNAGRHAAASTSASNEDWEFPTFIVYGWIAGFVVFVVEIMWRKIARKINRRKRNAMRVGNLAAVFKR